MITHILAYQYTATTVLLVKAFTSKEIALKWVEDMGSELKMWTLERVEGFNPDFNDFDTKFVACRTSS